MCALFSIKYVPNKLIKSTLSNALMSLVYITIWVYPWPCNYLTLLLLHLFNFQEAELRILFSSSTIIEEIRCIFLQDQFSNPWAIGPSIRCMFLYKCWLQFTFKEGLRSLLWIIYNTEQCLNYLLCFFIKTTTNIIKI